MKASPSRDAGVRIVALAAVTSIALATGSMARAEHRGALWAVVRACTLDRRVTGSPWPCLAVDRWRGFTVIPDPRRRTQLLVTPTARVSGIESPELQASGAPNLWWAAWISRVWLDRRAGRTIAPQDVGFAVNSAPGRTQDQLHIHIDCLRPSVRLAVDAGLGGVGDTWADLPTSLVRGRRYRARWLALDALAAGVDPFRLIAGDPVVGEHLALWTLVMVAAHRPTGEPGFVLLSHKADLSDRDLAAGEELLDHRCAALPPAPGR